MSNNPLEDELYEKLVDIKQEQLNFPESDHGSLLSFVGRLADVQSFAKRVMAKTSLTERTCSLLRTITISNIVASNLLLKLGNIVRDLEKEKDLEISASMARLSLSEPDAEQTTTKGRQGSTPPPDYGASTSGDTIAKSNACSDEGDAAPPSRHDMIEAREWTLEHLYKPYPSKKVKQTLAKQMRVSEDKVGTWFTHMRRRIGWTQIVKMYFNGEKARAVDAARFVFFEGKAAERRVGKAVCEALLTMKETAERVLKLPTLTEVEERIDRLANEVKQSTPDLQDSGPSSSSSLSSADAYESTETISPQHTTLKGTKRHSEEEEGTLSVRRVKRCRIYRVEPYATEVDEARSSAESGKRKRGNSEESVLPETKKRNICDSSTLLTNPFMLPDTILGSSLFDFDQTFPDTPALSPSSSYTGLDSCDWSTRSESPSTDQEYCLGANGKGEPVAHETQLFLDSCTQPDAQLSELGKLDQLWLDFTIPPPVITDAMPEGELDFVFSNFRDDPLTIDPALLSMDGTSSDVFGLCGLVNNPQSHDAATTLLSGAPLQLPADHPEAPDYPYIPTELADLLSSLNDTPNPATDWRFLGPAPVCA